MVRHYKYITFSDRREIAALYQANARPADIAEKIGVSTAAIYRELKRGETVEEDGARSGPEPAAGLQPGYRPADSTGEFQAAGADPGGRYARRFRR